MNIVYLSDDQLEQLKNIKDLIDSKDSESVFLGCTLLFQNFPSNMVHSEWDYNFGFMWHNNPINSFISFNPFYCDVTGINNILKHVIEQEFYILSQEISITS